MNGHTSNRQIRAALRSQYHSALRDKERAEMSGDKTYAFFYEGQMAMTVSNGILLEVIEGEEDFNK